MPRVIILIGIPGSGKSSFVSNLVQSSATPITVVSPDLIRCELYGSSNIQGNWTEIYAQIKLQFQESYQEQKSVIYDATNYRSHYRQEIITLSKNIGFTSITGIWLNVPLWICLERNEHRTNPVPENIIMEMYKTLMHRSPSLREGFDYLMIKEEGKFDDALL
ncbi:putative kinase [Synechococcus sp. PCC 7502]|uniref:AAA family ATPase n=1 Tax=Synechococcus sp. PCC 7502 TaxID=1173263 RepID=UPI00029F9F05|nr:AAA family ATPase [Synechococcus sp. PCC 7502]AFY73303.1 putative kinase [Synechococcus sp. PCC 7502]